MDGREGANGDTVLLVDGLILELIVEFVNFHLVSTEIDVPGAACKVPGQHFLHMLKRVGGTELRCRTVWPPDAQGHVPPHQRATNEKIV